MSTLAEDVAKKAADLAFSGVVRVEEAGNVLVDYAIGYSHRSLRVENTPATRFGLASGGKGFTALVVLAMNRRERRCL